MQPRMMCQVVGDIGLGHAAPRDEQLGDTVEAMIVNVAKNVEMSRLLPNIQPNGGNGALLC